MLVGTWNAAGSGSQLTSLAAAPAPRFVLSSTPPPPPTASASASPAAAAAAGGTGRCSGAGEVGAACTAVRGRLVRSAATTTTLSSNNNNINSNGGPVGPRSRFHHHHHHLELLLRISAPWTANARRAPAAVAADGEAAAAAGAGAAGADESSEGKFEWAWQWYPVAVDSHLDKRLPHAVTLLGRQLVVWWEPKGGSWQAFQDRCPHRLAPLSEGRVGEDGHLHCSYHGWAFAPATGACSRIPQAGGAGGAPAAAAAAARSPRACATVFPCRVHQGLVWVWPDAAPGARQRADACAPPTVPELDDPDFVSDFLTADLQYGYETLTENLVDPSHVPFAHHGIQGNRNSGQLFNFKMRGGVSKTGGFTGELPQGPLRWHPPVLITQSPNLPPSQPLSSRLPTPPAWLTKLLFGQRAAAQDRDAARTKRDEPEGKPRRVKIVMYCVPVAPGKSRLLFAMPRNFAKWVHYLVPAWVDHQRRMRVLISDLIFLHVQERTVEQAGGNKSWFKTAYLPTAADSCVVAFRQWLRKYGGGGVDWGGALPPGSGSQHLPPTPSRRELLDKYWMHVGKCPSCLGALRAFKVAETGLLLLSFALVALGGVAASPAARPRLGLAALAAFLLSKALSSYIQRAFYFTDYVHGLVK